MVNVILRISNSFTKADLYVQAKKTEPVATKPDAAIDQEMAQVPDLPEPSSEDLKVATRSIVSGVDISSFSMKNLFSELAIKIPGLVLTPAIKKFIKEFVHELVLDQQQAAEGSTDGVMAAEANKESEAAPASLTNSLEELVSAPPVEATFAPEPEKVENSDFSAHPMHEAPAEPLPPADIPLEIPLPEPEAPMEDFFA